MLKNITIKTKLITLLILPIVGLIIVMLTALNGLFSAESGTKRIYNDRVIPLEDLKIIADDYAVLVIDSINKANAGLISVDKAVNDITASKVEIAQKWKKYMATELTSEEALLAREAEVLFIDADNAIDSVLATLSKMSGNVKGKLDSLDGPLYKEIDPISEKITALVNLQLRVAEQEFIKIQDQSHDSVTILIGLTTVLSLILIIAFSYLFHSMMTPLRSIQSTIETISASSDLTLKLDIESDNELGKIASSFNVMISQMQNIISQILDTTHRLSQSAENLTGISVNTNQSITTQKVEIEQVATAMNEMVSTAQEIANNAQQADIDARETSSQAIQGNKIVDEAVAATNALVSDVENVSGRIKTLENDSDDIGSVIDVIKGIAEQTNLLALNAAIEAARAGDQGRGFAVVADEVRTLAQRTQTSTQEIQDAIERLQSGTTNAVTAMGAGQTKAENAGKKATEAGSALQAISGAMKGITDMNALIASASNEQTSVSEEINRSLMNIHDASNASSDGAQELSSASTELLALSENLENMVRKFKVA